MSTRRLCEWWLSDCWFRRRMVVLRLLQQVVYLIFSQWSFLILLNNSVHINPTIMMRMVVILNITYSITFWRGSIYECDGGRRRVRSKTCNSKCFDKFVVALQLLVLLLWFTRMLLISLFKKKYTNKKFLNSLEEEFVENIAFLIFFQIALNLMI